MKFVCGTAVYIYWAGFCIDKNNLTKLAIVSVYNCIIVEVTHECIFLINGRKN
jgi:hypothetical protein